MKKLTGKINKDMKIILKEMMKNNLTLEEYIESRKKGLGNKKLEYLREVFINLDEGKYISTGIEGEKAFVDTMIYENWGLHYETLVTEKGRKLLDWRTNLPLIMSSIATISSILVLILQIIEVFK